MFDLSALGLIRKALRLLYYKIINIHFSLFTCTGYCVDLKKYLKFINNFQYTMTNAH